MNGDELRRRLDRLGRPYTELAPLLGLSIDGLHHQMRGYRRVTRRTELLLDNLEKTIQQAEPFEKELSKLLKRNGLNVEPVQRSNRRRQ
jgi:hypothetical protein